MTHYQGTTRENDMGKEKQQVNNMMMMMDLEEQVESRDVEMDSSNLGVSHSAINGIFSANQSNFGPKEPVSTFQCE